ncbi:response regulator [Candidatus Micrarchaeota archaeon]|nr:response regulator [Candidatus Micrarchaeota archaeon]
MAKNILVVDDEPDIRESVRQVLQTKGYAVSLAEDGQGFLDELDKSIPDMVLLDIMMPGLTTKQILARVQAKPKCAGMKIMFLTALHMTEAEKEGLLKEKNVAGFVTKPFKIASLLEQVAKVCGK